MDNVKTTIEYYDSNAASYSAETVNADMSHMRTIFMKYVPNGRILDFGCGSGRDTKAFLTAGYDVDAIDGSSELCKIASKNTGINVRCMTFDMLDVEEKYNGIWACSSILHSNKKELSIIFQKISNALVVGGYLYASFKLSVFEGMRNDRYFTDFTEESFNDFIQIFTELAVKEYVITSDVRPGRSNEKWLNVFVEKR